MRQFKCDGAAWSPLPSLRALKGKLGLLNACLNGGGSLWIFTGSQNGGVQRHRALYIYNLIIFINYQEISGLGHVRSRHHVSSNDVTSSKISGGGSKSRL